MVVNPSDSAGVLLSATPGIGSFVTLVFSIANSELIVWLYQCYWELKDENENVILHSEDTKGVRDNQAWGKVIGSNIKQLTISPGLFEIMLESYSVVCIAPENEPNEEDRIGARIYLANTHVMDVHLS